MTKRFEGALTALVDSFFNDTLKKGTCVGCAVGNIVAHAQGSKVYKDENRIGGLSCDINNYAWSKLFMTSGGEQMVSQFRHEYGEELIASTGYSIQELARVEYAFETNTRIDFGSYHKHTKAEQMEDQYRGLMAVVEILCNIEGYNADETKEYKKLFEYVEK